MKRLAAGLMTAWIAGSIAGAVRADQVSDFEAQRRQQKSSYENLVRNMPPLDKHRVQDVMLIRVENKNLVLRTPLKSTAEGGFMRAKLDGVPGTALVLVQRSDSGNAPEPANFQLNVADYATLKQITTVAVSSQGTTLNISKSTQYAEGGFHSVMLMEQHGPQSSEGGLMQLVVNDSGAPGTAPTQLTYESPDFFTFLRQHPRESDKYLRPLLRELGQEAIFAPEALVAWQVFADLWKPDPSTVQRVKDLLPKLDSENYKERDRALAELQRLGRDGAAVMVHMDRTHLTPEQNARLDRALLPYAQLPMKDAGRLRSDPGFLLDCLYSEDAGLRRAALTRLKQIVHNDVQFDPEADLATRAQAITILRQQLLGSAEKAAG